MVYLEYSILGNDKKIKIDSIDYDNTNDKSENVIKYDASHYKYIVGTKEQKIFKILLKILKLWNELAEKYGIRYWACAGTLLGAVRHCGFIPWDNDIDISIMLSDLEKVKMILEQHPFLTFCENEMGLQVRYRDIDFPFMDIFVCDYYNENTIKYCGFISKRGEPTWFMDYYFPNEHIYKNELYPLNKIKFEDTTIMVPNIQKNTLFRMYSSHCLTACKILNHTDVHEVCSKNVIELRYHYMKKIYELERKLNIPNNIMFTSLQYKVLKKIEKKINNNNKKNNIFNHLFIKTVKNINYVLNFYNVSDFLRNNT